MLLTKVVLCNYNDLNTSLLLTKVVLCNYTDLNTSLLLTKVVLCNCNDLNTGLLLVERLCCKYWTLINESMIIAGWSMVIMCIWSPTMHIQLCSCIKSWVIYLEWHDPTQLLTSSWYEHYILSKICWQPIVSIISLQQVFNNKFSILQWTHIFRLCYVLYSSEEGSTTTISAVS